MSTAIEERGYTHPEVLVSTDWVAEHLHDPEVRIIELNEDPLLYTSGHIPGAVQVDWTADLNDPLRRDYLDKAGFEALMARIGVTKDTLLYFTAIRITGGRPMRFGSFSFSGIKSADHGRRAGEVGKGKSPDDARRVNIRHPLQRPNATTAIFALSASRC